MLDDDEFRRLLDHLNRPWAGFRKVRKGVKKRIRRHMQQQGCSTINSYLQTLAERPDARAGCDRQLLVTISRFFRDRLLWAHLRDSILPDLILGRQDTLTAWSAGCAGGEEPYSLAIVWEQQNADMPLIVTATDISHACLDRARKATYGRSSLKQLPDDLRAMFFDQTSSSRENTLKPMQKSTIHWQHHDLLDDPVQGLFQLIFLRNNLLTYYQGRVLQAAFNRILSTLVPGGYLIVGSHERLPPSRFHLHRDANCPWIYQLTAPQL